MTAADAARYLASYEHAIHAIGKASRGRGIYAGPGISVKLSALHPRYARAQHARVMAELLPRLQVAPAARPPLRHRPQHRRRGGRPARALARPDRGRRHRPRARRLGRHRHRRPGLPEALPVRARLADRHSPAAPATASWSAWSRAPTGTARSSAPRWTASPATRSTPARSTPTSPTSPAPRSCSPRTDAVYPQFATHNAYTLAAVHELGQRPGLGVPVPARHGRDALRRGRRARTSSTAPAASTPRSAPTRPCSPISSAACSRTAPTPPSSTAWSTPRSRSTSWWPTRSPWPSAHGGAPYGRIPLPRDLYAPERPNSQGIDLASEHDLRWLDDGLPPGPWTAAPILAGRPYDPGNGAPVRNPADHADHGRHRPRGHHRRGRARPGRRRCRRPALGRHRGRRARRLPRAHRRPHGSRAARADGAGRPRGRQDPAQRAGRGPRGGRLLPLLRRPHPRRVRQPHPQGPRPRRLHRPLELPARHLHRRGRGGPGRRQPRPRQARRADPADRRRRRAPVPPRRRARRRPPAPPRQRRHGGCGPGRRPARPGRGLHRLDRGGAADQPQARRARRRHRS